MKSVYVCNCFVYEPHVCTSKNETGRKRSVLPLSFSSLLSRREAKCSHIILTGPLSPRSTVPACLGHSNFLLFSFFFCLILIAAGANSHYLKSCLWSLGSDATGHLQIPVQDLQPHNQSHDPCTLGLSSQNVCLKVLLGEYSTVTQAGSSTLFSWGSVYAMAFSNEDWIAFTQHSFENTITL